MLTSASLATPARFSSSMRSPLDGVALPAWRHYIKALEIQRSDQVSERGGFGSYDLRPKRLFELGYVCDLQRVKRDGGRQIYTCRFLAPWTQERFLGNPFAQLTALTQSMEKYQQDLQAARLRQPEGLSLAGTLALLHCGGRGALAAYPKLFDHTRAVVERAQGAF